VIKKHQYSIKMAKNEIIITRLSFFLSIIIITVLFLRYPKLSGSQFDIEEYTYKDIDQIDIPLTHQKLENLPRPTRPSIPIAAETEDISDDLTLEEFSFEEYDLLDAPPPMPKDGPDVKFIPYDEPPMPIGGYSAIKKNLIYPELAREAGIEGDVFVQFFVDKKGRVRDTIVIKGIPDTGLDEAACDAIRKTRFIPAKQREIPVGVWISVPVRFKLFKNRN